MNHTETNRVRRHLLKTLAASAAFTPLLPRLLQAAEQTHIRRVIPSSGETIPVIGMGTSRTFDVSSDIAERAKLAEVVSIFFERGGTLIDSSPMYGNAEDVTGALLEQTGNSDKVFAATKVWSYGREKGIEQMQKSMRLMRVAPMDLIQVHNLRDWQIHLKTLRDWKDEGKVRYIGITTSTLNQFDAVEQIMAGEPLDFVQLNYNIDVREAEKRLLPLAADKGIATLINRPFKRGRLFHKVKGRDLPEWTAEFDCASWGQFFLKFVLAHPAATCPIPATSKPHHAVDNMLAGFGRIPDANQRQRMIDFYQAL